MSAFTDLVEDRFRQALSGPPHVSQSTRPHAYASEAYKCARQIGYRIALDVPEEPADLRSEIAFAIGNLLHDKLQAALSTISERTFSGFACEVRWDGGDITGRADGTFMTPTGLGILEIKTMNPKAYTRAAKAGEPGEGHQGQAMLSARQLGAKWIYIPYIHKASGTDETVMQHHFLPYDAERTEAEAARLTGIVKSVGAGFVPPRTYNGSVIRDPLKPSRSGWPCAWCSSKARCIADGPGVVRLPAPIEYGATPAQPYRRVSA